MRRRSWKVARAPIDDLLFAHSMTWRRGGASGPRTIRKRASVSGVSMPLASSSVCPMTDRLGILQDVRCQRRGGEREYATLVRMRLPRLVRSLSDKERTVSAALEKGLRAADAFVLRR